MTRKAKITFLPMKKEGFVPTGITILEAARRLEINLETPCNGSGRCGKDVVQIRRGGLLENVQACVTLVEADIEVTVPSHDQAGLQTVESFYARSPGSCELNPAIGKRYVNFDGRPGSTSVSFNDDLLLVEEGDTSGSTLALAVDLGTTTLAAALVDLNTGLTLGSASTLNPLVRYGHDVLSRISYCALHADGLQTMHAELISAVNLMIDVLASRHTVDRECVYQMAAAGNTTMQHIFLNRPIKSIGEYPYTAEVLDANTTSADKLAIRINRRAPVTTFPCASAFVGGDIVAGLMSIDLKESEMPALFVDIGTNGEIVLLTPDRMIATSCAAGPCFEGMTIGMGMRAGKGAIEGVALKDEVSLKIIGGGKG